MRVYNYFVKSLVILVKTILIKCKVFSKRIYILDSGHRNFDSICSVNFYFGLLFNDLLMPQKLRCYVFRLASGLASSRRHYAPTPKASWKTDYALPCSDSMTLRTYPECELPV